MLRAKPASKSSGDAQAEVDLSRLVVPVGITLAATALALLIVPQVALAGGIQLKRGAIHDPGYELLPISDPYPPLVTFSDTIPCLTLRHTRNPDSHNG
jgi:hypothetical protein